MSGPSAPVLQSMQLELADASGTEALAKKLAARCPPQAVLWLQGELGSGKSTLARALLRGLGVTGTIRSPSYSLVERYPLATGEAVHLDLYRLADRGEIDFLGLDELSAAAVLWLIEWPERGGGQLPAADLRLHFEIHGSGRRLRVEAGTATGLAWLASLTDSS